MDARDRGASRVAIVDWDAHHGDGTQAAFWRDGAVLTVSIHQEKEWLPGTGGVDAVGAGAGRGCNLNIPLPVGSGRGAYVESIARIVVPAIRRFHPDLIIVGAGFDANTMDPSARMMLHSEAFREMTRQILTVADAMCEGKVVFCVEGGYSDSYVPFCVLATVEELAGRRTGVEDPFLARWRPFSGDALRPHQEQAIESARSALAAVPDHGLCPKPQTEGPAGPWGPGRHRRARDAPS
jgi:acetoin utilization deacetylase AcuC-like enzyme